MPEGRGRGTATSMTKNFVSASDVLYQRRRLIGVCRLPGCNILRDINKTRARLSEFCTLGAVILNCGADGILSEHCCRVKKKSEKEAK